MSTQHKPHPIHPPTVLPLVSAVSLARSAFAVGICATFAFATGVRAQEPQPDLLAHREILDHAIIHSPADASSSRVGTITDLVVDTSKQEVRLVVAAIEIEDGERTVALPWSALAYNATSKSFLLQITEDELASLAEFDWEAFRGSEADAEVTDATSGTEQPTPAVPSRAVTRFAKASELQGRAVHARDGEIGELATLWIHPANGAAPLVGVEAGEMLDVGTKTFVVPSSELKNEANKDGGEALPLRLDRDRATLSENAPTLENEEQVLDPKFRAQVYEFYDVVKPIFEHSLESAHRARKASPSDEPTRERDGSRR